MLTWLRLGLDLIGRRTGTGVPRTRHHLTTGDTDDHHPGPRRPGPGARRKQCWQGNGRLRARPPIFGAHPFADAEEIDDGLLLFTGTASANALIPGTASSCAADTGGAPEADDLFAQVRRWRRHRWPPLSSPTTTSTTSAGPPVWSAEAEERGVAGLGRYGHAVMAEHFGPLPAGP
ncbi:hypothetical protein HBB16_00990 [Pseudonocardia sp. MCCB 268]|nr:hypothetical protein [Pseudonocardia cytotoxica]